MDRFALAVAQIEFGADVDYYPLNLSFAPPGVSLSSTTYPTTAAIQPTAFASWHPTTDPTNSGLLLSGYTGTVRFYLDLKFTSYAKDIPSHAFDLRMIPVNAVEGRAPRVVFHGP